MRIWLEKTFGCNAPPEYLGRVGKMFLISMVARIMQPGCQADYKLIIEGEQGKRKSSALRALVKNPEWFSDALPVLGRDEVRVSMHMRGLWLVEVPEMHATGKADNETVKSFITRRVERYIAKYGRTERYEPRQCIFAGTTNKDAYFTMKPAIAATGRSMRTKSISTGSRTISINYGLKPCTLMKMACRGGRTLSLKRSTSSRSRANGKKSWP